MADFEVVTVGILDIEYVDSMMGRTDEILIGIGVRFIVGMHVGLIVGPMEGFPEGLGKGSSVEPTEGMIEGL